jgi:hypothetical protein
MYSARLASRFPPRLRQCRMTLPEEASVGETPHRSLAKEASLLNLWGLSLRPRSRASRRCRCPAKRPPQGRLALPAHRRARLARRSLPRRPRTASHRTERKLGSRGHVARVISEAEACAHRDELLRRKSAQTVAQFLGCRHAQALELVGGLRPRLIIAERRAARRALIISTRPAPLLGTPDASPASTGLTGRRPGPPMETR